MAAKTVKQINPSELNHYLPIPIHKDFRKKLIPGNYFHFFLILNIFYSR